MKQLTPITLNLQDMGGCLEWRLLTGDDGVGLVDLLIPMFIHYGILDFISYKSFCTHM
jgi:hypothetical protein